MQKKNRWNDKVRCTKPGAVQQEFRLEQVGDLHGTDTADMSLDCRHNCSKVPTRKVQFQMKSPEQLQF